MRVNLGRHSSRWRGRTWFFVLACVALLLLAVLPRVPGVVSDTISYPLYMVRTWFANSSSAVPVYFRSRATLEDELSHLKALLAEEAFDNVHLRALEQENELLRGAVSGDHRANVIVADVVRRPNETPYDTLVVNKGSDDGVKEGALIYGAGEAAIGSVGRVYPRSAIVVLFSSPGVMTPVYVYGPNVFARAEGMGGGILRVLVPQGIPIAVGDAVAVPAAWGVYGTIEYVESHPADPAQYAFVSQKPTLSGLRFVVIDPESLPSLSRADAESALTSSKTFSAFTDVLSSIESTATSTTP